MAVDPNAAALAAGALPGQNVTVNGVPITVQAPSNISKQLQNADILHKQNPADPVKDGEFKYGSIAGWVNSVGHVLSRGIDNAKSAFEKIIHATGQFQIHRNDPKKPVSYTMNPGHHLEYTGGGKSSNHDGHHDHATKGSSRNNSSGSTSHASGKDQYHGAGKSKVGGTGGDGGAEIHETTKWVLVKKDLVNTVTGDKHDDITGDIFENSTKNIHVNAGQDIYVKTLQNYNLDSGGNIQILSNSKNVTVISSGFSSCSGITVTPTSITMAVGLSGSSKIYMDQNSITLQVGNKGIKIDSSGVSITGTTWVGQNNIGDKTGASATAPVHFP